MLLMRDCLLISLRWLPKSVKFLNNFKETTFYRPQVQNLHKVPDTLCNPLTGRLKVENLLKQVLDVVNIKKFDILQSYFHSEPPEVRLQEVESDRDQSTTDILKDMITQKKNLLLSKLTSFDSDVSDVSLNLVNLSVTFQLGN